MTEQDALSKACIALCTCSCEGRSVGIAFHDSHCPFKTYPDVRKSVTLAIQNAYIQGQQEKK